MAYDYTGLFESEDGIEGTWKEFFDDDILLPQNLLNILKRTIFLPHDFYDIVAAYFMLPSALCSVVPYLFLYGQSGSGKSTVAKLASRLHGVTINSSSDTFAGIRNSLEQKRTTYVEIPSDNPSFPTLSKTVERNTCMVWDDVSANTFSSSPDLYNMFKFGYDKSTDKIIISSKETGVNLEFRCFCPKVFSSISPLHLDERFKELKRRLIVIPCKRVEELSEARRDELDIKPGDWQSKLLDMSAYNWTGLSKEFDDFWDYGLAESFVTLRKSLGKTVKELNSQQRTISLDLMACGIACGIWKNEQEAVDAMKVYWSWFKDETEQNSSLTNLLKDYIVTEAKNAGIKLEIYTAQIRSQVNTWVQQGWLYEPPRSPRVKEAMLDLGFRLQQGKWSKG